MKLGKKLLSVMFFLILFMLPLSLIINNSKGDNSKPIPATINNKDITPQNDSSEPEEGATSAPPQQLIIGDPNAKVILTEYGDFQCPFCRQFFKQTEPEIKKAYIDTGKAKIEFRVETHIGQESVRAGEAAYCSNEQRKFHAYHDALFTNQNGENDGAFSDANLKRFAKEIGLDLASFDSCLDNRKYLAAVEASNSEAKKRGVNATPTIFIGENKIVGAQPFSIYQRLIDEQL